MNPPLKTRRHRHRIAGTACLIVVTMRASAFARASERDELATVQRQLDQVQLSLERARVNSAQADPAEGGRYFFDYRQATSDLNTIRSGIERYLAPSRAQPRDTSYVGGNYRRERP